VPTVLKIDGFRFFFFSDEHTPEHIHIEKGDSYIMIEIESLKVTNSYNINGKDTKKLVKLVAEHKDKLKEAWNEYFKQ